MIGKSGDAFASIRDAIVAPTADCILPIPEVLPNDLVADISVCMLLARATFFKSLLGFAFFLAAAILLVIFLIQPSKSS